MKQCESPDIANLLPLARRGDQEAQMEIVTAFRPLLRKLASQERDFSLRMESVACPAKCVQGPGAVSHRPDLAERACGPVTGHWPKDRTCSISGAGPF
jgi:iron only hydrogenase large subunit-like protein